MGKPALTPVRGGIQVSVPVYKRPLPPRSRKDSMFENNDNNGDVSCNACRDKQCKIKNACSETYLPIVSIQQINSKVWITSKYLKELFVQYVFNSFKHCK
jgi:collagenase-like PrtC family protease